MGMMEMMGMMGDMGRDVFRDVSDSDTHHVHHRMVLSSSLFSHSPRLS